MAIRLWPRLGLEDLRTGTLLRRRKLVTHARIPSRSVSRVPSSALLGGADESSAADEL